MKDGFKDREQIGAGNGSSPKSLTSPQSILIWSETGIDRNFLLADDIIMKTLIKRLVVMTALCASVGVVQAADVKELWDKHCASCHAKDGSGNTKMGKKVDVKDYRDPKVQAEIKDDKALKVVKEGITEKGKERMKPYADKLTDDEIKALIAHIRTFKKSE
jgi:cytochrome c553